MRSPNRTTNDLRAAVMLPLVAVALTGSVAAQATTEGINWSSALFASGNADSTGGAMDAGFVFYLGVFDPAAPAWEPTAGNTAEWAANWVGADAVVYNPFTSSFASSYTVESTVNGVVMQGKQGYIWGMNRGYPDGEWILVTDPEWVWPAVGSGGVGGFGLTWTVSESVAVIGQVDEGGVHMQTAAVNGALPPLLDGELWRQTYFTQTEIDEEEAEVSGWSADPNGNGRSNLLEFALGTNPRLWQLQNEPEREFVEDGGMTYQALRVTRDPNALVGYEAEVSGDLVSWFSDGANVGVDASTATEILFRDLTPRSAVEPFRGIRLRVQLP